MLAKVSRGKSRGGDAGHDLAVDQQFCRWGALATWLTDRRISRDPTLIRRDPTLVPADPTLIRRDPTLVPADPTLAGDRAPKSVTRRPVERPEGTTVRLWPNNGGDQNARGCRRPRVSQTCGVRHRGLPPNIARSRKDRPHRRWADRRIQQRMHHGSVSHPNASSSAREGMAQHRHVRPGVSRHRNDSGAASAAGHGEGGSPIAGTTVGSRGISVGSRGISVGSREGAVSPLRRRGSRRSAAEGAAPQTPTPR